jgi:hypothetical protein
MFVSDSSKRQVFVKPGEIGVTLEALAPLDVGPYISCDGRAWKYASFAEVILFIGKEKKHGDHA